MERKIGETFEYEGKTFKVAEAKGNVCIGCFFNGRCYSSDVAGDCESECRSDKKDVIFVEIQEQPHVQAEQPQLNLCEILKHCPQGETFWSPMLDGVKFSCIDEERQMIIVETIEGHFTWEINADGTISIDEVTSPEVMLYPSKEMRDWSKFTAPWYKKEESIKPKFKVGDIIRHKETNKDDVYEISKVYDDSYGIVGFNWGIYIKYQDQYELIPNKFDPKTLKAFDRVIVWDEINAEWFCANYSHRKKTNIFIAATTCGNYLRCIPYNDDTKYLVGTKEEAPEFYRYWED